MCLWYFTRAPIVLHANENRKWKSRKDREIIFLDQKFLYFFRRWYKIESVLFWISEIRDKFDRGYIKIFLIVNMQIFNEKVEHSKVCRLLHCLRGFSLRLIISCMILFNYVSCVWISFDILWITFPRYDISFWYIFATTNFVLDFLLEAKANLVFLYQIQIPFYLHCPRP